MPTRRTAPRMPATHAAAPPSRTTACRMRPVTRLVLAQSQVAQLDAELATHGSTRRARPPCRPSNGLFVIRARTTSGRVVDLAGACPEQLGVDFDRGEWLRLGPASAAMVSTGLDVSYR